MSGEWEIERLDLDAYLQRIGYDADLNADGRTLSGLHRAHMAAIPFENLDVVLGRGVAVDLDSVQRKLVDARRGGYCYEHGLLFGAVLERVGFTVDRLLARIGDDTERPRPRTHMALHVHRDEEQWLADVGFGGGLREPLVWGDTRPHRQGGWTYRMTPTPTGSWHLGERLGSQWAVLYSLGPEPQHAADVVMANHFTSTYPDSPFVGQPVVMRNDDDLRRRLRGRELSLVRPDGSTEQRRLTDTELTVFLRDDMGLPLTDTELASILGVLPAYAESG